MQFYRQLHLSVHPPFMDDASEFRQIAACRSEGGLHEKLRVDLILCLALLLALLRLNIDLASHHRTRNPRQIS